ncbi:MAG: hypothetical protein NT159_05835, partial [Proteobacteria bacterium]|nr:hypothetical protein [Pseudomonadota bacterium]
MPFIPLAQPSTDNFPTVSAGEQAARDATAERILASEFSLDMPDENRVALETEYRNRFGKEPPLTVATADTAANASGQRGFIPLANAGELPAPRGFIPLESEQPSTMQRLAIAAEPYVMPALKTVAAMGNPVAVAETAGNLLTQIPAFAGYLAAGGATAVGRMLGDTDQDPKEAGGAVADAMTYHPRTEAGQHLSETVLLPLTKLNEGAEWAGHKVADATGSPVAGALTEATGQMLPAFVAPAVSRARAFRESLGAAADDIPRAKPALEPAPLAEPRGFIPIDQETTLGHDISGGAQRLAADDQALPGSSGQGLEKLRRTGSDGLPGMAGELPDLPEGHRPEASPGSALMAGPDRNAGELRTDERGLAGAPAADFASEVLPPDTARTGLDHTGDGEESRYVGRDVAQPTTLPAARLSAGDLSSATSLPEGFQVSDARWADHERSRVGEDPGREGTNAASTIGSGIAAGTGIEVGGSAQTGFKPLRDTIDTAAHEAATSPLNDMPLPSPAQIEVGNYKKGAIKLHGLDIAIENPAGSIRSGVSPEGKPWQTEMQHHYGYFRTTMGKDGDPVDVFIGRRPESRKVFVIDQIDPKTGRFDEHKAVLGAESLPEAQSVYRDNYEPGWRGAGAITEMTLPQFKDWLYEGNTRQSVGIKKLLGQPITEHSDAALAKLRTSPRLTEPARAKVEAEIERRAAASEPVQDLAVGVQNSMAPGINHIGFVDDSHSPAAGADVTRPKPITREEVLAPLLKALDTTLYEGRVKGPKNRLGFFRPKLEEVRVRRKSDIETASHEIAHLVDDRVPEIRAAWKADKALESELRSISYDSKKVNEGFAEGMRLYLTQPEALQAKAPKVYAWLEDFTNTHKYGPALRKAQEGMTSWFAQDGINRARSKIGTPINLNDAFDGKWDKFRQSVSDDLHGVYRMERDLTGKLKPNGAYESARLSRASQSIADGAIRYGAPYKNPDGSFTFQGKGLEEILKPVGKNLDDSLLYFVGKSADELMGQGREHLFTKGEIDSML